MSIYAWISTYVVLTLILVSRTSRLEGIDSKTIKLEFFIRHRQSDDIEYRPRTNFERHVSSRPRFSCKQLIACMFWSWLLSRKVKIVHLEMNNKIE